MTAIAQAGNGNCFKFSVKTLLRPIIQLLKIFHNPGPCLITKCRRTEIQFQLDPLPFLLYLLPKAFLTPKLIDRQLQCSHV